MNTFIESFEKFKEFLKYRFTGFRLIGFIFVWFLFLILCGAVILIPGYMNGTREMPFEVSNTENETASAPAPENSDQNQEDIDTTQNQEDIDTSQETVISNVNPNNSESEQIRTIASSNDLNGLLNSLDYLYSAASSINNLTAEGLYSSNIKKWEELNKEAQELVAAIDTYKDNTDPDISKVYAKALTAAKSELKVTQDGLNIAQGKTDSVETLNHDLDLMHNEAWELVNLIQESYDDDYRNLGLVYPDGYNNNHFIMEDAIEPTDR